MNDTKTIIQTIQAIELRISDSFQSIVNMDPFKAKKSCTKPCTITRSSIVLKEHSNKYF